MQFSHFRVQLEMLICKIESPKMEVILIVINNFFYVIATTLIYELCFWESGMHTMSSDLLCSYLYLMKPQII